MAPEIRTLLSPAPGCLSLEAALLLAQLEDMHSRLRQATSDLGPEEIGWQPAPGLNSLGMLLAHIAVAESHLTAVGLLGQETADVAAVIGIGAEDDGMPLPAGGRPPAVLAGREIAFFHGMLDRSHAYAVAAAATLGDADLEREVVRPRPDGATRVFNVRWMLHHIVEHLVTHYGQVLLLRRLYRKLRS